MSNLYCTDLVKCELGCKNEKLCKSHGVRVRTHYLSPIIKSQQDTIQRLCEALGDMIDNSGDAPCREPLRDKYRALLKEIND